MRCRRALPPCLALALLAGSLLAQPRHETLSIDAAHSSATFAVKVLWVIPLHGEFAHVGGTIQIDHFRGSARVDARIDCADLAMRNARYQEWAKSAEFFDAARHPRISFASDWFPLARLRSGGTIEGELSLRGVTRSVQFRLQPAQCAAPLAGECAVRADGEIARGDFGMRARRATLGDTVGLRLQILVAPRSDGSR